MTGVNMPTGSDRGWYPARALYQASLALLNEFERTVQHAEQRNTPGMRVPYFGDFAPCVQLPSVISRMRRWSRELNAALKLERDAYHDMVNALGAALGTDGAPSVITWPQIVQGIRELREERDRLAKKVDELNQRIGGLT